MGKATGRYAAFASCLSAATLFGVTPSFGNALTINSMPASAAVSRVDQAFGTNIYVGYGIDQAQRVSFNVPETAVTGGRMTAISYLAHQLDANHQTVLIVSKSNGNAWNAPSALDTDAYVTFTSRTLPAVDVLHQIGYVDNAAIRYAVPVNATVTLSNLTLPATQAVEEVATQAHIALSVAYRLMPRSAPARPLAGTTIIGYTAGGLPITSDQIVTTPVAAPQYAHRTARRATSRTRYAHRRPTGSISITSVATPSTSGTNATGQSAAAPVYGDPPATLLTQPSSPTPPVYTLPGDVPGLYGTPYPYASPYAWNAPYSVGNGVTIVPSAPSPTVVVP